jgi:hypothetical protein
MTSTRFILSAGLAALFAGGFGCGDDTGSGGGNEGGGSTTTTGAGGDPATTTTGAGGDATTTTTTGGDGGGGGAGFNVQINGSGYAPHNGEVVYIIIRDAAEAELAAGESAAIAGGNFTFTFEDAPATATIIDYYVDLNDDMTCTTAGQPDHVWRDPIPANGVVDVTHDTDFSQEACDGF